MAELLDELVEWLRIPSVSAGRVTRPHCGRLDDVPAGGFDLMEP